MYAADLLIKWLELHDQPHDEEKWPTKRSQPSTVLFLNAFHTIELFDDRTSMTNNAKNRRIVAVSASKRQHMV
jgi:hypothetical protein